MMKRFEVGHTYYDQYACDHETLSVIKIVKRTPKTVVFERHGKTRRAKLYEDSNGEYIVPDHYSMACVYRAERELVDGEPATEEHIITADVPEACGDMDAADTAADVEQSDAPAYAAYVKAHKPEILSFLIEKEEAEKKAMADRQAKIDAIEGLKELEAANEALLNYREAFNRAIENDDAIFPSKPSVTPEGIEALRKKFPRAAAYRKAEAGSLAANYVQASAYKKALERIINGDDYEKALADADAEWKAYLDEHIWD